MSQPQRDERWHVGKEIPLVLIFMLFVQTAGWIWWAATQSAKLDTLTAMMADFRSSQYTTNDARRDQEITFARHKENARRIESIESTLQMMQQQRQ